MLVVKGGCVLLKASNAGQSCSVGEVGLGYRYVELAWSMVTTSHTCVSSVRSDASVRYRLDSNIPSSDHKTIAKCEDK
jgi:hypothetical protein